MSEIKDFAAEYERLVTKGIILRIASDYAPHDLGERTKLLREAADDIEGTLGETESKE